MKEKYLTNARIIDPKNKIDEFGGLIIDSKGLIKAVGKKVAQKSAVATKAPAPWYSEEVSGERLRELMEPVKLIGNWHYMGSRGEHHFVSQDQIGRKIYRVLETQYPVEKPFPLTPFPSRWRKIEITRVTFDPELLDRFRDGNGTELPLLPESDQ